ncbi:formyltransferase family protein [Roseivirga misakiensis]|uniref:Formyl transferase N-terminal domain-containing protein n=1 Tax=Roseivirga misakiensis TaxID=1563681 RepID=A0A1E5T5X5_9BACT|nr:formyltransferase family protein [Roseivirga misakiensis]OEK06773.1 hypothetical protein BFP71_03680 [Roseivirga misakiensis]
MSNLVLVTNSSPRHIYWAKALASTFSGVSICIVRPERVSNKKRLKDGIKKFGYLWLMLKLMSSFYHKFTRHGFAKRLAYVESESFKNQSLDTLPDTSEVFHSTDVNSDVTISWINNRKPKVVCFLGGDIARKKFFDNVTALVLNYHSGLSPLFNGSSIAFHCVAKGRPNLSGGTLMVMNERIDGGNILAYYLPEISESDNASTLFLKGIQGSVELYIDFLNYYLKNSEYHSLKQERSLNYFGSNDWTIWEDIRLKWFEGSNRMRIYKRPKNIINVYDRAMKPDLKTVYGELLSNTLSRI